MNNSAEIFPTGNGTYEISLIVEFSEVVVVAVEAVVGKSVFLTCDTGVILTIPETL